MLGGSKLCILRWRMFILSQSLAAWAMGLISAAALIVITAIPGRLTVVAALLLWLAFLIIGVWYLRQLGRSSGPGLALLLTTATAGAALLSLMEWPALRWFLIILIATVMVLLYYTMGSRGDSLFYREHQPYRRLQMMLWVFDSYALVTLLFALSLFFPQVQFWPLALGAGVLFGYTSYMIWNMYAHVTVKRNSLWLMLIGLMMIELVWVMHLLPFSYLTAGLLVTWLWYILQLLLRFHFGPKGIVWPRQRWFLVGNGLLYILALTFFVRWV